MDGPVHFQRLENLLAQKIAILLAADRFDDAAKQNIAGVVVDVPLARFELERQAGDHLQQRREARAQTLRFAFEIIVALDARGVVQQVTDSDAASARRKVGQKSLYTVVERQQAALFQHHHGGGCELLGQRGDAEHHIRRYRDVPLKVGQAIAFAMQTIFPSRSTAIRGAGADAAVCPNATQASILASRSCFPAHGEPGPPTERKL